MTKKQIRLALERFSGSPFIKTAELAKYLKDSNVSRVKEKYLKDLEYLPGKLYFCDDVAEVLANERRLD